MKLLNSNSTGVPAENLNYFAGRDMVELASTALQTTSEVSKSQLNQCKNSRLCGIFPPWVFQHPHVQPSLGCLTLPAVPGDFMQKMFTAGDNSKQLRAKIGWDMWGKKSCSS